jgi:hypothetical protein
VRLGLGGGQGPIGGRLGDPASARVIGRVQALRVRRQDRHGRGPAMDLRPFVRGPGAA